MDRDITNHSQSPVRGQSSPRRRSPSRRDHRSSHKDSSPAREKHSNRGKSPKPKMSHSRSPPARNRVSQRDESSTAREKNPTRTKSPRREKSRSLSPRTKRLRRAQTEREAEKVMERDHDRNHGKGSDKSTRRGRESDKVIERDDDRNYGKEGDKSTHREKEAERDHERNHGRSGDKNSNRERGADRVGGVDRKQRRSGREEMDGKSSRGRHGRSSSPSNQHNKIKRRSYSPQPDDDIGERNEVKNLGGAERRNGDDDDGDSVAKMKAAAEALEAKQKQKPSFELSGKLAAETNTVKGVTLLFTEPPDARKPTIRWRLYVFKGGEVLNEPLYIHRQSCYLFGRERRVADVPTDHPSCSKQHAIIQFRQVEKEQPDGTFSKTVRPYLMDLGSTNKTFLNDNPIEPQRYYELFEKDTLKFGNSSREYVLLHENSAE